MMHKTSRQLELGQRQSRCVRAKPIPIVKQCFCVLAGCIATAKDREQLERQIREAIEFHIEGLKLNGEPIPPPTTQVGTVAVA